MNLGVKIIGMLLVVLVMSAEAAAVSLSIATADSNPVYTNSEGSGLVDRVAQAVFQRLGWQLKISHLPSERALINANEGIDDGELMRVPDKFIVDTYPNLIKIPEPWMNKAFIAFTNQEHVIIKSWGDLTPYTVGFITGWRMFEENTRDVPNRIRVKDEELLFGLIKNDRAQIILYDRVQGQEYLRKEGIQGVRVVEPPLAEKDLHFYLNKKHAGLVDAITDTLKNMKKDGSYQKLLEHEEMLK
ncbi:MAG: transporter substrate-binding domain-containing protein [Magnetococcales bacterium]|nr:transporter substrate-binding domain-containing protein [Magnetococcales bacterium]